MTTQPARPASRPSRILPAILAILVIAEACVIVYLLSARNVPTHTAHTSNTTPNANSRIATLETENAQLKKALAARPQHRMAPGSPVDTKNVPQKILDTLATPDAETGSTKWLRLAALQNVSGMDTRVFVTERPFDPTSNKLSPAFLSLFEITSEEQAALEKTITATREQINALTLKNATTRTLADGSVEIKVDAFPEAGGTTYDQFHDQLRNTLGQDRYTAVQATSGRELDMMFSNFGAENRTVTISHNENEGGVSIKDVGKHEGMERTMMMKTPDMESARERLGNLAGLLPPNF